jgi:hypothetical protein
VLVHSTPGCDRSLHMVCRPEVGRRAVARETLDSSLHLWRRRCSTSRCCGWSTVLSLHLHMPFRLYSVSKQQARGRWNPYHRYTCWRRSLALSSLCQCSCSGRIDCHWGCDIGRCQDTPRYLDNKRSLVLKNMVSRYWVLTFHWGSLSRSATSCCKE